MPDWPTVGIFVILTSANILSSLSGNDLHMHILRLLYLRCSHLICLYMKPNPYTVHSSAGWDAGCINFSTDPVIVTWSTLRSTAVKPTTHPFFQCLCVCPPPPRLGCFGACSCSVQLVVCLSGRSWVPTAWQLDLRLCLFICNLWTHFNILFFKKMHIDIFGRSNRCACELNWSSQK
jgi:hypothetical protein